MTSAATMWISDINAFTLSSEPDLLCLTTFELTQVNIWIYW